MYLSAVLQPNSHKTGLVLNSCSLIGDMNYYCQQDSAVKSCYTLQNSLKLSRFISEHI